MQNEMFRPDRLRRLSAAFAFLGVLGLGEARAQAAGKEAVPALSQRTAVCAACHGANGNAQLPNSPSLAGQPKVFLEQQLIMIREGLRVIPQMAGILDGMPDEEITAIAQHYADLPIQPQAGEKREEQQFARGSELAGKMHCASCHMANYEGREQMPRLAGQREDYLVHSMRDFHTGKAIGRDTMMASVLHGVSDQDIQDMAHYLAHLK